MKHVTRRWHGLAALSLALLIAGCGGASGPSPTTGSPAATGTKAPSAGRAATTGVNTLTFTASGGLAGPITLSANLNTGTGNLISYHLASQQRFYIDLTDQSGKDQQQVILDFTGYTGPGTYTISPAQAGATADENVQFEIIVPGSDIGTNLWLLDSSTRGTCTVTVTSVTPVSNLTHVPLAPGSHPTSGNSEVQGTITCASVPVYLSDGTPPLTVSDGRFDVLMVEQQ